MGGADADTDAAAGASAGDRGRLYVPRPLHWSGREANDSSVVMAAAGASQGPLCPLSCRWGKLAERGEAVCAGAPS